jgi:hypothetical protein
VSAPAPLRLRPLEIGDILDETFRLYRRNFLVLGGVSVAFSLPLAALAGYGIGNLYGTILNQTVTGTAPNLNNLGSTMVVVGAGYLVYVLLLPLQYGTVTYAVCELALGHPVTVWSAFRGAFRRYLHLLGFVALVVLMAIVFCLFPLWIWILVGWVAVLPAIFVENLGLGAAMSRSWRLVQGRWWRTFLIVFLVYILNSVVSAALGGFLYLGQLLLSTFLPAYLTFTVYEAAVILVNALVIPVLVIAIVLIYFDLRVRKEGMDLFQLAGRINSPSAVA